MSENDIKTKEVTLMQALQTNIATRDHVSLPIPSAPDISGDRRRAEALGSSALSHAKSQFSSDISTSTTVVRTSRVAKTYVELFNEAEREGFRADARKCWAKLYEARRLNNPESYALIAGPAFTAMQRELDGYLDADDPDVPYYLITVNPKDTVRFATLAQRVSKCLSKKWIRDTGAYYCYVFEQRGTDASHIHGIHAHIMLERPVVENGRRYKYSCFTREVRSTFTSIVGGVKATDIRPIKPGTESRVIQYFKGIKKDPAKQPAIETTIAWRRQQGIQDFYEPVPFGDVDDTRFAGAEEEESASVGEEGDSADESKSDGSAQHRSRRDEDEESESGSSEGSDISVDWD